MTLSRTRRAKAASDLDSDSLQCVSGVVTVFPPRGVGAVIGQIRPEFGAPIRFRQVVGPAGGPIPITSVDGTFATVCGRFIVEDGRVILDVRRVIPRGPGPAPGLLLPLLLILVLALALPR